jgi:hypothetical protein
MNKSAINFLQSFFKLFRASIENVVIEGKSFTGIVKWENDEGAQAFSWDIPEIIDGFDHTIELMDYLSANNLINIDKISISKDSLTSKLKGIGWTSLKINNSIDYLCSITVPMVDDGKRTDSFFIHF